MKTFKHIVSITLVACGPTLSASGFAQSAPGASKMDTSAPASLTDGEVRRVDPEAGKITLKHGDIKHLDMPGMTMVFPVRDKNLLANVKAGDKVRFMVVNDGGRMVVTDIQPANPAGTR